MSGNVSKRIRLLWMLGDLLSFAKAEGVALICTSFYRTQAEQDRLYEMGKSKVRHSKHQDWLAVDLAVVNEDGTIQWAADGRYQKLGEKWEELGGIWGGRWESLRDIYHFEV